MNSFFQNGIPVSREALEDTLPLMEYFEKIEALVAVNSLTRLTVDVRELADTGKLKCTQSNLDSEPDVPVFAELELPVVFESDAVGYIIDGHRRLQKAYCQNAQIEVFWFK